jgi:K+-sensing histidine kinase KdpD
MLLLLFFLSVLLLKVCFMSSRPSILSAACNHLKEHNFLLKLPRYIHIWTTEQDVAFHVAWEK